MASKYDLEQLNFGIGAAQITENHVVSDALDLFSDPQKEIAFESGRSIFITPKGQLLSEGPHTFQIDTAGANFYKLNISTIYGQCKITKQDGSNIPLDKEFSVVNMFPASLYKSVDMEIDNVLVSPLNSTNQHYKTYIDTLLSYSSDARRTHLKSCMFIGETGVNDDVATNTTLGAYTAAAPAADGRPAVPESRAIGTSAYAKRYEIVKGSRTFDWTLPLNLDFMCTDRLFPPGKPITLRFARNNDAFSIITPTSNDETYKVQFVKLILEVRMITLDPTVQNSLIQRLTKEPCTFPICKTEIKNYDLPQGNISFNESSLFSGVLPKSIILCMVKSAAYQGQYKSNGYNFEPFDNNYCQLEVNGEAVPGLPYTPNFDQGLFLREYYSLYRNIGIHRRNEGCFVTPENFASSCYFLAWDLSPNLDNSFVSHRPQSGNIKLSMTFAKSLPTPVTLLAYASWDIRIMYPLVGPIEARPF